jgi:hypothetical protein
MAGIVKKGYLEVKKKGMLGNVRMVLYATIFA